ncbi:leucine-rich repeat, cysteine-containing subtype protein [Tanacetum coccineum]
MHAGQFRENLVPKADSSDGEFDFNDDGLCEVANACSRLREVHLSGRLHIGDVGVVSLIRSSKNLTDLLKLDGCVTAIGEANHLKYLSFRGCYLVTDLGLEYLANGDMKNCLERLHLNECDMISDYGICHLKQMTGLYYLSLSKCGVNITNVGVMAICQLPSLMVLNLSWLRNELKNTEVVLGHNISWEDVSHLRQLLPIRVFGWVTSHKEEIGVESGDSVTCLIGATIMILSGKDQRVDRYYWLSRTLVGQESALIACLRIRTLFRRRPTEALGRGPIVRVQPRLRSLATRLGFLLLYFTMSTIRDIKSKLNKKALDALCTKYHIPASVHPCLPGSDKSILQSPDGKIGVYSQFFNFANYRLPLSQFLVDVLGHFRIHLSQLSIFGAAKMDLFAFIRHFDPTKVRVGKRNLADSELKLLKMTEGRTVALDPPATAVSGGSSDNIDRLFDEGDNAGQEHSAGRDDVQEKVISKDASEVEAPKETKEKGD